MLLLWRRSIGDCEEEDGEEGRRMERRGSEEEDGEE
jgi:hypothetical protein